MIFQTSFRCFEILIFWAVRGVKGQKMAQNDKKILSSALHISGTIYHTFVIYGTLVYNDDVSSCFFHFFKTLILRVVRGRRRCKGQKMVQNGKIFCLSCSISQESYIIWFSFVALMFKMIIPPGDFFIFSKFSFSRLLGGVKGQKIAQNDKKILSVMLDISGTIHHVIIICDAQMYNDKSPGIFFLFFQNFHFLGCWEGQRAKMAQNESRELYIIWSKFMVCVCKRIISPGVFYIFSKF